MEGIGDLLGATLPKRRGGRGHSSGALISIGAGMWSKPCVAPLGWTGGGCGMYSDYIHVGVPSLMGSGVQAGLSPWLALPCRLAWAMQ